MDEKSNNIISSRVDLQYLKKKGLSDLKISRMTGIPVKEIKSFFEYNEDFKNYSGVF